MRIAFVLPMFPVLSETFILNQITGLVDRGHDVRIFAFSKDYNRTRHEDVVKYDLHKRLEIVEAPRSRWKLVLKSLFVIFLNLHRHPRLFVKLAGTLGNGFSDTLDFLRLVCCAEPFLKHGPFDVLHCHFGPSGFFAVRLKELIGWKFKVATTFHGFDMTRYVRERGPAAYEDLFAAGDLFLPVTETWKGRLMELGCPKSRIRVHRMGISLQKFPRRSRDKQRNQEPTKILSVGRLVEKKGVEYGIKAIAKLVRQRPTIPILYEIVGEGPLRRKLDNLIHSLGCEQNVKMLGGLAQEDVSALMKEARILLAPSVRSSDGDQEGLPVVLMEALASGLIVCSTFHSGIPELIVNGQNGFLVPERDENCLCEILENIIDGKIDQDTIIEEGYRSIAAKFDIDKLNDQLIELFTDL